MGSFGERLRREREMRGITLDEIAEATKIGTRSLRALEQEQFEKLPGGIFNKGFVRAYARFLGIDEEQAVADYLSATDEKEAAADGKAAVPAIISVAEPPPEEEVSSAPSWRAMAAIVLLAALLAGGWYGYNRWKRHQEEAYVSPVVPTQPQAAPSMPAPAPPENTADPVPVEASTTAVITPTAAAAVPAKPKAVAPELKPSDDSPAAPITVKIRALSGSWIKVTADDEIVMSGMLSATSEKLVHADNRVVLDIGNAGGVEITQNGKLLPSLGPEGKRRVLTITPEGVQR